MARHQRLCPIHPYLSRFVIWSAGLLMMCGSWLAQAQAMSTSPKPGTDDAPVVALLSLIGDRLHVVSKLTSTGTNLEPVKRDSIAIDTPMFDQQAMNASIRGLRRVLNKAEFAVLNARSPVLFERQASLFERNGQFVKVPDAILDAARQQGANRLLLILKRREDANFSFASGDVGTTPKLEGLGFFLDASMETYAINAQGERTASGRGFVAPYVFIDLLFVDVASSRVLGERGITAARTIASGTADGDPATSWNAMTSADRARIITQLLNDNVERRAEQLVPR
jgi:hypothetical protein